jgi:chromate reductase
LQHVIRILLFNAFHYSTICLLCEVIIMSTINLIGISGSLRRKSANSGLLRAAKAQLPADTSLDIADLSDIPFYNEDITEVPASVARVLKQISSADALVLACTEYNYSMAPALKNILDWASRSEDKTLLAGKSVAIMGAGGGMGTSRAQYHLRQVCVFLDLHPLNKPEVFANAFAGGFDQDGNLVDEKIKGLIKTQLSVLIDTVKRNK